MGSEIKGTDVRESYRNAQADDGVVSASEFAGITKDFAAFKKAGGDLTALKDLPKDLIDALASGRSYTEWTQSRSTVTKGAGFKELVPGSQDAVLKAIEKNPAAEKTIMALVESKGFQAMGAMQQQLALDLVGKPGGENLPQLFDHLLNKDGRIGVSSDTFSAILNDLSSGDMQQKVKALDTIAPSLVASGVDSKLVTDALRAGNFSDKRAGGIKKLLTDETFLSDNLNKNTRTNVLKTAAKADDTQFDRLLNLAVNDRFPDLRGDNEGKVLKLVMDRPDIAKDVVRMLDAAEFVSPGDKKLSFDQTAKAQSDVLDIVARKSPKVTSEGVKAMSSMMEKTSPPSPFMQLDAKTQAALLDHLSREPVDLDRLKNATTGFGAAEAKIVLETIASTNEKDRHALMGSYPLLSKGPVWASLSEDQRRMALTSVSVRSSGNRDKQLMSLHYLVDSEGFKALSSGQRDLVLRDIKIADDKGAAGLTHELEGLLGSKEFQRLTGPQKEALLNAMFVDSDPAATAKGLYRLLLAPGWDHHTTSDDRTAFLQGLSGVDKKKAALDGYFDLMNSKEWRGLSGEARSALAKAKPDALAYAAYDKLLKDPALQKLDADKQTAVVAQASYVSSEYAIDALRKFITTKSAKDAMGSLADFQRVTKIFAFTAEYAETGPVGGRQLVKNTVAHILSGDMYFRMKDFDSDRTLGSARGSQINMARSETEAGNGRFYGPGTVNTLVHETSHNVNGDVPDGTYKYFMGEFRAYAVGDKGEKGEYPSRETMMKNALHLLNTPTGAYGYLYEAYREDPEVRKAINKRLSEVAGFEITDLFGTPDPMKKTIKAGAIPDELVKIDAKDNVTN